MRGWVKCYLQFRKLNLLIILKFLLTTREKCNLESDLIEPNTVKKNASNLCGNFICNVDK